MSPTHFYTKLLSRVLLSFWILLILPSNHAMAQIDTAAVKSYISEQYARAHKLHFEQKYDEAYEIIKDIIVEANKIGHHGALFTVQNLRFTGLMVQNKTKELDSLLLIMDQTVLKVDDRLQCFYWYNKAKYQHNSNSYSEARTSINKALSILHSKMPDYFDLFIGIQLELASIEKQNKNYKKTQQIYSMLEDSLSYDHFKPNNKNRHLYNLYNAAGVLGKEINDPTSALNSYKNALKYALTPQDSNSILYNMAVAHEKNGDLSEALSILNALKEDQMKLSTRLRKAFTQLMIYEAQNDTQSYIKNVDRVIDQVNSADFRPLSIFTNLLRSIQYYFLADYEKAKEFIKKAEGQQLEKESFGETIYKINKYKYLIEAALSSQFDYAQNMQSLLQERDSLNNLRTSEEINKLHIQYQTDKKDKENQQLQTEKEIQQIKMETQKRQLYSVIIAAAIITLLLLLMGFQYQRVQQKNAKILHQNQQIQTLHRELNHRVKNNLAFMTSLLEMQIRRINSPEAKAILAESENRLKALALVHTQLFQNEGKTHVNIKDYLTALVQSLQQIFTLPDKTLAIELALVDFETHAEDAMRLGLIINEAITNSVKHAFKDIPHPKIFISGSLADNGKLQLQYKDNGPGAQSLIKSAPDTLGLTLIDLLKRQLGERYILLL